MQEASVLPLSMFATEIEISHSGRLCTGYFFLLSDYVYVMPPKLPDVLYQSTLKETLYGAHGVICILECGNFLRFLITTSATGADLLKYKNTKCKSAKYRIQKYKRTKIQNMAPLSASFSTLLPPRQTSYKTLLITTSATPCIHLYRLLNVCLAVGFRMPTFSKIVQDAGNCEISYTHSIEWCVDLATKYITLTAFFHRYVITF